MIKPVARLGSILPDNPKAIPAMAAIFEYFEESFLSISLVV